MEYNVPNTIVPQDVIDNYLKTYERGDLVSQEEIIATSERLKAKLQCDGSSTGKGMIHIVVGPSGSGKTSVVQDMSEEKGDQAVWIDRYEFLHHMPSFTNARMSVQTDFDGDLQKLRNELAKTTQSFLNAALWIENDVMTCAVNSGKTVFLETSGKNTLKLVNRLNDIGVDFALHVCVVPLAVCQDSAAARYKGNPEYAVSDAQIEQEYNRLIEILPELCKTDRALSLYTRPEADLPPVRAALITKENYYEIRDYDVGVLDGILGGHRLSFDILTMDRTPANAKYAAAPAQPALVPSAA